MKKFPLYITIIWIAMGIFVSVVAYRMGLGRLSEPGPGFMPFWLGIVIGGLGLYKLFTSLAESRNEVKDDGSAPEEKAGRLPFGRIVFAMVALFVYALLIEPLGYVLTTFLAMALLLRFAGYTRWGWIIVYSIVITAVSYLLFHFLGVRFPVGIFNFGLD